jgi:hypothetical protein
MSIRTGRAAAVRAGWKPVAPKPKEWSVEDAVDFGAVSLYGADGEEARDWAKEGWQEWRDNLSEVEMGQLEEYTDNTFCGDMNDFLRKKRGVDYTFDKKELKDGIAGLDSALAKGVVPQDMVVYRGLGRGTAVRGLKVGDTFRDRGFSSTSLSERVATKFADFDNPVVAEIRLRKGQSAGFLSGSWGLGDVDDELEVLLPRGSAFKIVRRLEDHLVLEIVGETK